MKRIQMSLSDEQWRALTILSAEDGVPIYELIRRAIDLCYTRATTISSKRSTPSREYGETAQTLGRRMTTYGRSERAIGLKGWVVRYLSD
jgi:hypothetical protein